MELDFSQIPFCGRKHELRQLRFAFQAVHDHPHYHPPQQHDQGKRRSSISEVEDHVEVVSLTMESSEFLPIHPDNTTITATTTGGSEAVWQEARMAHPHSTTTTSSSSSSLFSKRDHRIIFIEGDGGTGKSMLAEHFLAQLMRDYPATLSLSQRQCQDSFQDSWSNTGVADSATASTSSSSSPLLIGRGKFEEGRSVPFAALSEVLESLMEDLLLKDPTWAARLDAETRAEIGRLASVAPKIKQLLEPTITTSKTTTTTTTTRLSTRKSSTAAPEMVQENNEDDEDNDDWTPKNLPPLRRVDPSQEFTTSPWKSPKGRLSRNGDKKEEEEEEEQAAVPEMSPFGMMKAPIRKSSQSSTARTSYATDISLSVGRLDMDDDDDDDERENHAPHQDAVEEHSYSPIRPPSQTRSQTSTARLSDDATDFSLSVGRLNGVVLEEGGHSSQPKNHHHHQVATTHSLVKAPSRKSSQATTARTSCLTDVSISERHLDAFDGSSSSSSSSSTSSRKEEEHIPHDEHVTEEDNPEEGHSAKSLISAIPPRPTLSNHQEGASSECIHDPETYEIYNADECSAETVVEAENEKQPDAMYSVEEEEVDEREEKKVEEDACSKCDVDKDDDDKDDDDKDDHDDSDDNHEDDEDDEDDEGRPTRPGLRQTLRRISSSKKFGGLGGISRSFRTGSSKSSSCGSFASVPADPHRSAVRRVSSLQSRGRGPGPRRFSSLIQHLWKPSAMMSPSSKGATTENAMVDTKFRLLPPAKVTTT
jgi:hypothetical protein